MNLFYLSLHLLPSIFKKLSELRLLLKLEQSLALSVVRLSILLVNGKTTKKIVLKEKV